MFKRNETGSALILVPVGVLVLVMLGAIAVDSSIAFLAQRELQNNASAAVNDAVTVAIPQDQIASNGVQAEPDLEIAQKMIERRLESNHIPGLTVVSVFPVETSDGQLTVEVRGEVQYLFAKAIPGAVHTQEVHVRASADLAENSAP